MCFPIIYEVLYISQVVFSPKNLKHQRTVWNATKFAKVSSCTQGQDRMGMVETAEGEPRNTN